MTLSSYRIPFLIPYFVEIQRKSFLDFLAIGLIFELSKKNPIYDSLKEFKILFYPNYYQLTLPDYTPKTSILKFKTYKSKLYVPIRFTNCKTKKCKLQWILLAELPLMTKRGNFIINGAPRIIVNQIVRSPGIYYKKTIDPQNRKIYYADLISQRGAWLRFEVDKKNRVWVQMKKTRKIPILIFFKALGIRDFTIRQTIKYWHFLENSKILTENIEKEDYIHPKTIKQSLLWIYTFVYPQKKKSEGLTDTSLKKAKKFLFRKFFSERTYDLGYSGRLQLNKKFNLSTPNQYFILTCKDFLFIVDYLLKVQKNVGLIDDIDHLKNRKVRTCGELIQNQFATGLIRLEKLITDKTQDFNLCLSEIFTSKAVDSTLRQFFSSSPLSQFMDQTNPLAELTHKRRISSLGPGGISRETAGMDVRGIHPSHYGRICPIETPEGRNAGLVNSLTTLAKIHYSGLIETPFFKVFKGQIQTWESSAFFSPKQEQYINLAPSDLKLNYFLFLPTSFIFTKQNNKFKKILRDEVEYIAVSVIQMISVATSLIPFLEHDDANRALMGSNMQRQAVPLILPERPIVGTGLEARVVSDSGHGIQSKRSGKVSYISSKNILVTNFPVKKPSFFTGWEKTESFPQQNTIFKRNKKKTINSKKKNNEQIAINSTKAKLKPSQSIFNVIPTFAKKKHINGLKKIPFFFYSNTAVSNSKFCWQSLEHLESLNSLALSKITPLQENFTEKLQCSFKTFLPENENWAFSNHLLVDSILINALPNIFSNFCFNGYLKMQDKKFLTKWVGFKSSFLKQKKNKIFFSWASFFLIGINTTFLNNKFNKSPLNLNLKSSYYKSNNFNFKNQSNLANLFLVYFLFNKNKFKLVKFKKSKMLSFLNKIVRKTPIFEQWPVQKTLQQNFAKCQPSAENLGSDEKETFSKFGENEPFSTNNYTVQFTSTSPEKQRFATIFNQIFEKTALKHCSLQKKFVFCSKPLATKQLKKSRITCKNLFPTKVFYNASFNFLKYNWGYREFSASQLHCLNFSLSKKIHINLKFFYIMKKACCWSVLSLKSYNPKFTKFHFKAKKNISLFYTIKQFVVIFLYEYSKLIFLQTFIKKKNIKHIFFYTSINWQNLNIEQFNKAFFFHNKKKMSVRFFKNPNFLGYFKFSNKKKYAKNKAVLKINLKQFKLKKLKFHYIKVDKYIFFKNCIFKKYIEKKLVKSNQNRNFDNNVFPTHLLPKHKVSFQQNNKKNGKTNFRKADQPGKKSKIQQSFDTLQNSNAKFFLLENFPSFQLTQTLVESEKLFQPRFVSNVYLATNLTFRWQTFITSAKLQKNEKLTLTKFTQFNVPSGHFQQKFFVLNNLQSNAINFVLYKKITIESRKYHFHLKFKTNLLYFLTLKNKYIFSPVFNNIFKLIWQIDSSKLLNFNLIKNLQLYFALKKNLCAQDFFSTALVQSKPEYLKQKYQTQYKNVGKTSNKVQQRKANNKRTVIPIENFKIYTIPNFNFKVEKKTKIKNFNLLDNHPTIPQKVKLTNQLNSKEKNNIKKLKVLHLGKQKTQIQNFNLKSQFRFLSQITNYSILTYQHSNQNTCINQIPLVSHGEWIQKGDFLSDGSASAGGDLALGKSILVAYMPWEGFNFEDAILINERLIYDDLYTSVHIEKYKTEIYNTQYGLEEITTDIPNVSYKQKLKLDSNGIIKIGSWVTSGDILVGKITPIQKKHISGHEKLLADILEKKNYMSTVRDTSLRVPKHVSGRIVHIEQLKNDNISFQQWFANKAEKKNFNGFSSPSRVHIYIAEKRKIQVGDKMSGRHGNKGIISNIIPRQDMPYLADGTPIDMVLNPLGVPSRMNVGQIFECLLGLAANELNEQVRVSIFDEMNGSEATRSLTYSKLFDARLKTGKQWLLNPNFPGKMTVFDGRTGETFKQAVTVGKAYMLKLVHLVDEKIHARSTGPYSLVTQQPLRGRSKHGGQRLGEMEVWALEGFGAAYTLQEFLTTKSDDIKGRHQVMQAILQRKSILLGTPESFKVLLSELQSLCLNIGVYSIDNWGIRKKIDIMQLS